MTEAPAAAPGIDWDALIDTAQAEDTKTGKPLYDGVIPDKFRALIKKASDDGKRYVMPCNGQAVYDQFVLMGHSAAADLPAPNNNFYPRARFKDDALYEASFTVGAKRARPETKPRAAKAPAPTAKDREAAVAVVDAADAKTADVVTKAPVPASTTSADAVTRATARKPGTK